MPFLSLCVVLFSEGLGPAGETLAQCSRPPVRISYSLRDLPSHVLVIASPLVCGARRVFCTLSSSPGPIHRFPFQICLFIYSVYAFLVPTPLLGQTAYERLLRKFDV